MNIVSFLRSFVIIFVLVFIVSAITTFLYSLIAHGTGLVDWESAFRFGLIFGISLPLVARFEGKK
jgi:hypothetical protein